MPQKSSYRKRPKREENNAPLPLFSISLSPPHPTVTEQEPVTGSWVGNCLLRMKGLLPGKRLKETSNQIKGCWDGDFDGMQMKTLTPLAPMGKGSARP